MDPQGVRVQGFKQPTAEEQDHDFLWRVHPHALRVAGASPYSTAPTTKK
jgi:polyphosphate kinase 2 (PPK2 family)